MSSVIGVGLNQSSHGWGGEGGAFKRNMVQTRTPREKEEESRLRKLFVHFGSHVDPILHFYVTWWEDTMRGPSKRA